MHEIPPDANCTLPYASTAPADSLEYEVCVVGGGLAGLCAALSAARYGRKTVLIQDRAVLGGNASSEIRMWALGANGADNRETGIMEEIRLANLRQNPDRRFSVWDHVLYGMAREQDNLTLLLSSAVCDLSMQSETKIASVKAWHLTRQRWLHISAAAFIDCSGDSILRLSGAPCRWGRETRETNDESLAREVADRRTMGNTILIQLREINPEDHREYEPPAWALEVDEHTFPNRKMMPTGHNFWWLELGGMVDTINDADHLRDDLMALAHGVWAFIKNHPDGRGHAWELEWIGSLPGKRENVRYEGDHILTQNDILSEGRFEDMVAHGGWTMDDHPPEGIYNQEKGTTHHKVPSPYGIPYRTLYSRTVENLWFAGRNISATHMAMSSTRVMATCATLGQAAGTAAAIAVTQNCNNREVYTDHLYRLQRRLLNQDQWLPGFKRPAPLLTESARIHSNTHSPDILLDGIERRQSGEQHHWEVMPGDHIQFEWSALQPVTYLRIIGDSQLHVLKTMPCSFPLRGNTQHMPATLPREIHIDFMNENTQWVTVAKIIDNHKRLIEWQPDTPVYCNAIRVTFVSGWKNDHPIRIYSCEIGEPTPDGPLETAEWPESLVTASPTA